MASADQHGGGVQTRPSFGTLPPIVPARKPPPAQPPTAIKPDHAPPTAPARNAPTKKGDQAPTDDASPGDGADAGNVPPTTAAPLKKQAPSHAKPDEGPGRLVEGTAAPTFAQNQENQQQPTPQNPTGQPTPQSPTGQPTPRDEETGGIAAGPGKPTTMGPTPRAAPLDDLGNLLPLANALPLRAPSRLMDAVHSPLSPLDRGESNPDTIGQPSNGHHQTLQPVPTVAVPVGEIGGLERQPTAADDESGSNRAPHLNPNGNGDANPNPNPNPNPNGDGAFGQSVPGRATATLRLRQGVGGIFRPPALKTDPNAKNLNNNNNNNQLDSVDATDTDATKDEVQNQPSRGPSGGAIAGIVLGSLVGVGVLAAIGAFAMKALLSQAPSTPTLMSDEEVYYRM
jgi:hypothetical protein